MNASGQTISVCNYIQLAFIAQCTPTKIEVQTQKRGREIDLFFMYGKGKAIPLQVWTFPEVSRRLRLPDLKTIGT
jgi:hypothetical protein